MPHTTPFDQFSHATNRSWFSAMLFLLRIVFGILFLTSAWSKIVADAWTSQNYLLAATGPFASWFQSLAGVPWVDVLNMYGQLAIGLALLLGFCVRPAAFFGVLLMGLYYTSQLVQNTTHGFIDDHVMYALLFLLMLSGGFGHIWGIDGVIARQPSLQRKQWVRWLFG